MRLPESKIQEAILHPDARIRQRAVHYFADCFSRDRSIVPLIIQAVERYGREGAYFLIGAATNLVHTDETIAWVVEELNREDADQYENYTFNLARVLGEADPTLLLPRETRIREARHLLPGFWDGIHERLEMLSWDEAACWQELEAICEAGKDETDIARVDFGRAGHVLEALARIGRSQSEERVLSVISQPVVDFEGNPLKWMELLMLDLAGRIRLPAAVPIMVERLDDEDYDLLGARCERALIRIGADEAVAAIAARYPGSSKHFRLYSAGALYGFRSDLSAETTLSLLAREKDRHLQRRLAEAALAQFAYGAIEPVRQVVRTQTLNWDLRLLRDYLVETCAIMEEHFPEYDEWRAAGEREREERRRDFEEIGDDPNLALLHALQTASDYFAGDDDEEGGTPSTPPRRRPALAPGAAAGSPLAPPPARGAPTRQVGRNDPCPCGSGKKFKKCCMRKQGGSLFG